MDLWILELIAITFLLASHQVKTLPKRSNLPSLQSEWSDYNVRDLTGPGTYLFGYDVEDDATNNVQFRNEERHFNGTVTGSYGYMQPDGNILIVHYTADKKGYRATLEDSKKSYLKNPSPEMVAAMDAIKVFKKQKKFEQRERPLDVVQKKTETTTAAINNDLETKSSSAATSSTTAATIRRIVTNKAHAYYYFPRRKEVAT